MTMKNPPHPGIVVLHLNYAQNERSERWFRAAGAVRD
jgi:hypothetical protein